MRTFGLLGRSLSHSFSKKYFTGKFEKLNLTDCQYVNMEIPFIEDFPEILKKLSPEGFNVTIPYKEAIIPYLDELDEVAEAIGAVNTVKVLQREGKLYLKGFNTDAHGFHQTIKPFLKSQHTEALILGTGGASKAVAYVLKQYGITVRFATRNKSEGDQLNWEDINSNVIKHHLLIVNSTPLGMYPEIDNHPELPYDSIGSEHLLVDLIYNPEETQFMRLGRGHGAVALNGLTMLEQQAEKAWSIWNEDN